MRDFDALKCAEESLHSLVADFPDSPDAITLENIQNHVGSYTFGDPFTPLESMRLFAEIKKNRWAKTWSNQMVKFGGASLAALAVLVIVGTSRRTRRVESQDDQLLTNIE